MKKNEIVKKKLVGALAIMDEEGRLNQENNSYMLWIGEWKRLRELIYECLEMVDKSILDLILDEVE